MSRYESSHGHVPLAMQTVRAIADGADGYRLLSPDDDVIGWVRGRAIGVSGFDHEDGAASAALRAYGVLASWL